MKAPKLPDKPLNGRDTLCHCQDAAHDGKPCDTKGGRFASESFFSYVCGDCARGKHSPILVFDRECAFPIGYVVFDSDAAHPLGYFPSLMRAKLLPFDAD
jgi:hypothetical protein